MDDLKLLAAELSARKMAHDCNVYTGVEVTNATRSSAVSAACGRRWVELRTLVKSKGLTPYTISENKTDG